MSTMSYAREIRSSLSWHGTSDIQSPAKYISGVLKGNGDGDEDVESRDKDGDTQIENV